MDPDRFERVEITSDAALWDWLGQNHARADGVWLVTWKAIHPERYVSREVVLDALIAHGWIDGRRLKLDDARTMQLIAPRKQTAWAQSYKTRAARLEAEGRMHPSGLAALAQGRQSGRWHETDPVDVLIVPDDLALAIAALGATDWWQAAAPSYRRNVLRWIALAKRPETRRMRIDTVATAAARREKVPHY